MQQKFKSLMATSLAHFANDGNTYVFITLYPALFPLAFYSLGGSKLPALFLIGVLVAIQNVFSVFASPVIGRIADKTGRYGALISLGLILTGTGILGYALSVLFASGAMLFLVLIPFAIVAGVGSAFYHPLAGSVLSQTWPYKSIGRAMGINGSSGSSGRAIYPLLVVVLAAYLSIPSVSILGIVSLVIGILALIILKRVNLARVGKTQSDRKSTVPIRAILRSILALTFVSFMRGIFSMGIVSFVPEYLERVGGINFGLELGLAFSLVLTLPVLGQIVFGSVADKFGRRLALGITILGSGTVILALLLVHNVIVQIACLALFGFFTFTQFPLVMPLATGAVPKEAATLSNSIVWGIGNSGGGALGPFLVGLLASPSLFGNLNGAFLVVTIISLSSLAILPLVRTSRWVAKETLV